MIKKLLLYFCTFNLLLFAGCDPIFGPVIRNGLDHDVRVYYTYTNGTEFEYVIPPDNDLLWYHQNIYILNSLVVTRVRMFVLNYPKKN